MSWLNQQINYNELNVLVNNPDTSSANGLTSSLSTTDKIAFGSIAETIISPSFSCDRTTLQGSNKPHECGA